MSSFNRIGDAIDFFEDCRKAVGKLRALDERMKSMDENGYLRAVAYEVSRSSGARDSETEKKAIERDELWAKVREAADRYAHLLYLAQLAICEMEEAGADSAGDVSILDYYYLQAKEIRECADLMHLSEDWTRHKKALALVHVAPFTPRQW